MKSLAPIVNDYDLVHKLYVDGKFLSGLSVNGNNLQYTINGVDKLLTVPYASYALYATNIRITNTEPTSGTTYYPTFVAGLTANTNYGLRGNDTILYQLFEGTTTTDGFAGLLLGNSTSTGTEGNAFGYLRLYGKNTGYTQLLAKSQTSNYTTYLPSANGTLVYHTTGTAIGSTTAPVYVDSTGKVTACGDSLNVRIGAFTNNAEVASSSETPSAMFEGAYFGTNRGMYMTTSYQTSNLTTPTSFGNIINLMGMGGGQIFASWAGSYSTGHLYYRSHRDNTASGSWTPWVTILDSSNYATTLNNTYVKKAGDTMTGQLGFSGTTYPHIYGNSNFLILSGGNFTSKSVIVEDNGFRSYGDNVMPLGISGNRWSNIYSVLGNFSGQITSSVATGIAPFVVASTTKVTNLNAEFVNGYTVNRAGFVTNTDGTTTMVSTLDKQCNAYFSVTSSSYWTKFATITAPSANGTVIVTLLVGSEHQGSRYQGRGILELKLRNDSGTPTIYFSAVSGDIDCSCFRFYYPTTIEWGTECELWVNVKRTWQSAVIKVLNETSAYEPINNIKMVGGRRTEVETPTLENYVEPTRISMAASADVLTTSRTLWGQSFDGSANVSGSLTGVGNITGSGAIYITTTGTNSLAFRYNNADATSLILNGSAFKPYDVATGAINLGTSAARWYGIYGQTLNLSGGATVSGTTTLGSTLKLNTNQFITTASDDLWTYNYTDADGNAQTIKFPHYGYVINTTPAAYIGGGYLSNYFGLNFHVGAAATKIRFGCSSGDSLTWGTTLSGDGVLTLAKSASIGTNLTVAGTSKLTGVVYTGTTLYTHGKTGTADGKAGFYAASGYIGITGATPYINFYFGNSTSVTSAITEYASGALRFPSTLRAYTDSNAAVSIDWFRNGYASWRSTNTSGNLIFQCNYTTAVQSSWYDVFKLDYNSGNATLKGTLTSGHLYPTTNGGANIGATATRWNAGYFSNFINIGAANSTYGSGVSNTYISAGCLEFSATTPCIVFHCGNSTSETNRIIEGLSGQLTVTGKLRVGLASGTSTDYNFHVAGTAYASTSLTTPTANVTTLRRIQSAASSVPTIWVSSGNYDNTLLRVDYSQKTSYLGDYGFSLKYMGTGGSYQNNLNLYADNTSATTQNIAWSVNQYGQVAIRTTATNTSYDLYVNSTAYIPTLTITALKIGDATITWDSTNGALKIDQSVYSSGSVSALGYSGSTSDGSGSGIVSTVLSEYNLINTDLSEDVTVVASAYATKNIYNSVKTNTSNISTLQTNYSALRTTVNSHTDLIEKLNVSQFYSSGDASTGLSLTWYTESGAGRTVTIPTWNSLGQTWDTYDNTPCLVSNWLLEDIADKIRTYAVTGIGTSGNYLTYTSNYETKSITVPYASYSTYSNSVKSSTPTDLSTAYTTGYLKTYYAGGSNTVTNKPTDVDAFGMISMQTASGYTGQILISANTSVNMYWKTASSGSLASASWKKILDDSNTSFTQTLKTGMAIGTITIGGTSTTLYAPYATSATVSIVDNLTSTSTTSALSANQGKVLNDKFADYLTTSSASSTYMRKLGGSFTGEVQLQESDIYGSENDYEYWRINYFGEATFASVNGYTLGAATADTLGFVKVGAVRTSAITTNSATSTSGRYYKVEMDSNNVLFVNIPWTNTTTTAGSYNKLATKLFLVGTTSQSSSGLTTYSNSNVYIGTDNALYANAGLVINDTTNDYTHSISYDSGGNLVLNGSEGLFVNSQLYTNGLIMPMTTLRDDLGVSNYAYRTGYFNTLVGVDSSGTQMWKIDGSNSYIYTGAKTSHSDGVQGCVITNRGMFICADDGVEPYIQFCYGNSTSWTSLLRGTSTYGVKAGRNLDVYCDGSAYDCYLALTYGGSTSGKRWRITNTKATSSTAVGLQIEYGSNTATSFRSALSFTNSGAATFASTVSCTTLTQTSDARYKNILGDITLTASQIANAPAVYFTWNSGNDTTTRQVGTTAQYWKQYVPEAIVETEGRYGLNYSALAVVSTIVLARSIETHEQRITRLEERIKALEEENEELINKLNNM